MLRKLGILLMAIGGLGAITEANAQDKVTLIASTQSIAFATSLVAESMGYFKTVGLDLDVVRVDTGTKVVAAIAGGNGDIGLVPPSLVLKGRSVGMDIKMFATLSRNFTTNTVFSKEWAAAHNITEDSTIDEKAAALRGARVGVSGPGMIEQIVRYMAHKAQLNPDRDLTIIPFGNDLSVMIAAMSQGRIDAFSASPPTSTIAVKDYGAVVPFNFAAGKVPEFAGFPHIVAFAQSQWLDTHKVEAEKFAKAMQMALDAVSNPADTNTVRDAVKAQFFPAVDQAIFADIWLDVVKGNAKSIKMDDQMFVQAVALEKVSSPDFSESLIPGSYTNEFADKVSP
jgi:NitT/TauT family transport system substrate-binding protein